MGRNEYKYIETPLIGGINQAAEVADLSECADARNVWAPRGKLEQRPGFLGRGVINRSVASSSAASLTLTTIKESPANTFTNTSDFSNLPVGDRWYMVFTPSFSPTVGGGFTTDTVSNNGFAFTCTSANTNAVSAYMEYWDGTGWVWCSHTQKLRSGGTTVVPHLGSAAELWFSFPAPLDLATTTVNAVTGYAIRFTMIAINGSTVLSAAVTVDDTSFGYTSVSFDPTQNLRTIVMPRFQSGQRIVAITGDPNGSSTPYLVNCGSVRGPATGEQVSLSPLTLAVDEPASLGVVPETSEAFIAYNRKVFVQKQIASSTATDAIAIVETADFAVGPSAPFDRNYIDQRSDFPPTKYVAYFQNRLWFATDTSISWGAALPYHKVLPTLSVESLAEDDNSTITGIASLNDNMVVFKERSIWIMVFDGLNAFNEAVFRRRKVISGVGCTSNASIRAINGELIFLSERGLYAFDGQAVRKITVKRGQDRLVDLFATLAPSRRKHCVSVDWKKRNCYMLSVALNGASINNNVIVWNYERDEFEIWDSLYVEHWLLDELHDHLYFVNYGGNVYEIGSSNTNHGGTIVSYATSQRMGLNSNNTKSLRSVNITSSNTARQLGVECLPDDAVSPTNQGTGSVALTDFNEKEYDSAVFDTDVYTEERRRQPRTGFHLNAQYFQVKLTHSVKNTPWSLSALRVGFENLGIR